MNDMVYDLYVFGKKMLKLTEEIWSILPEDEKSFFSDLKLTHVLIEEKKPEYLERYKRELSSTSRFKLLD